jgi:hypothetical protein
VLEPPRVEVRDELAQAGAVRVAEVLVDGPGDRLVIEVLLKLSEPCPLLLPTLGSFVYEPLVLGSVLDAQVSVKLLTALRAQ